MIKKINEVEFNKIPYKPNHYKISKKSFLKKKIKKK